MPVWYTFGVRAGLTDVHGELLGSNTHPEAEPETEPGSQRRAPGAKEEQAKKQRTLANRRSDEGTSDVESGA